MEAPADSKLRHWLLVVVAMVIVTAPLLAVRSSAAQMPDPAPGTTVELDLRLLLERARSDNPEVLAQRKRRWMPCASAPSRSAPSGIPRSEPAATTRPSDSSRSASARCPLLESRWNKKCRSPGSSDCEGRSQGARPNARGLFEMPRLDWMARVAVAYFDSRSPIVCLKSCEKVQTVDVIVQQVGTRCSVGAAASSLERGAIVGRSHSNRRSSRARLGWWISSPPSMPSRVFSNFRIREAEESVNYARTQAQLRPLLGESPLGKRLAAP